MKKSKNNLGKDPTKLEMIEEASFEESSSDSEIDLD
jgi:hypothetical protein